MSGVHRAQETESRVSRHPLDEYVTKSITRLDRLFSGEHRSNTSEDGRELLAWWREAKLLLNMHTNENQVAYRLRAAFAQKSLSPLFDALMTDEQYERLTDAFTSHFKKIQDLISRFDNGPGQLTADSVVRKELDAELIEMRKLHLKTYRIRQNR